MAIFEISENFTSLEGEGPFMGHTTTYIRFARCNLSCPLFNNPEKQVTPKGYAVLPFNIKDYSSLKELPPVAIGCDTQYAVNPEFSHMWAKMTTDELVDDVIGKFPFGYAPIVSLTGGEPTLKWKQIPEIMNHPKMENVKHYLVETNCSVPFKDEFITNIYEWLKADPSRRWTWSNSPKLANSGHTPKEAIKPAIAALQYGLKTALPNQVNQYFKFVSDGTEENVAEIKQVMEAYYEVGIPRDTEIWLMPEACNNTQQMEVAHKIVAICMMEGWKFCLRLQNVLWDNLVGT